MDILWFIPGHGDSRYLGTQESRRNTSFGYLATVARAVDSLGYTGALLPTGAGCEDSWTLASGLMAITERMKFLIAIRPGSMSPTLAARMAASFDRLSGGRLLLNIITGGDPKELAGDGTHLSHDERYEVTDEFLSIYRQLFTGEEVNFQGKHTDIRGGKLVLPPFTRPYPPLYFGGSSPAGHRVAGKHIDVYLSLGEPPDAVAEKIADVRAKAAEHGRTIRIGMRLHIVVRETEGEAWDAANAIIKYVDDETIAARQAKQAQFDSVGQSRQRSMRAVGRDRAALEISPNLWAGIGLVNIGVGTALVGDGKIVAERMREYMALGVDTFILSGYPHLEEAYRVAELVFPQLPEWNNDPDRVDQVFRRSTLPTTWQ